MITVQYLGTEFKWKTLCHILLLVQRKTCYTPSTILNLRDRVGTLKHYVSEKKAEVWRGEVTCPTLVSEPGLGPEYCPWSATLPTPLYLWAKVQQMLSPSNCHQELFFKRRNLVLPHAHLLAIPYYNINSQVLVQTLDLLTLKHYPCPNWKWASYFII